MLRKAPWMARRATGRAPKEPASAAPRAPNGPQLAARDGGRGKRGANPFLLAGAAFAAGTLLAKIVDWRGHAHPKR